MNSNDTSGLSQLRNDFKRLNASASTMTTTKTTTSITKPGRALGAGFKTPNLLENTLSPIVDKELPGGVNGGLQALLYSRTRANIEEMAFVDNLASLIKIKPSLDANSCLSFYEPELSQLKAADDQKFKREQEKLHVLKEIIASERKYLNDINEIVEGYYAEIYKLNQDNEEFVIHIFSNIKEILEFTKTFYEMLELNKADEIGVANCFIEHHKTFLKLYSTYCQNYKIAYSTTERLEYDRVLGKVIQKVKLKYGHSLRIATYLQLPVLRITKYHLLLQRFLRSIEAETVTYKKVQEALDLMKRVNDQINKDMPEFSPNEKLLNTIDIEHLTELFGSVLKQGDLILSQTKTTHQVILLQNMLIIRKAGPSNKIMHMIASEYLAYTPKISKTGNKKFQKMFTLIDYSQAVGDRMCQFTFKAKSVDEKLSWQSAILSCMLHGYGKKLTENVKSKFMEINNESMHNYGQYVFSNNSSFNNATLNLSSKSNKSSHFKRLADIRSSLKTELRKITKFDKFVVAKGGQEPASRDPSETTAYPHFIKIFDRKLNEFDEPNFTNIVCNPGSPGDEGSRGQKSHLAMDEQTVNIDIDIDRSDVERQRKSTKACVEERLPSIVDEAEKCEPMLNFSVIQHLGESASFSAGSSNGSAKQRESRVEMRKRPRKETPILDGPDVRVSSLSTCSPPFSLMLNEQMPPELDIKSMLSSSQPSLSSPSVNSEEGYFSNHDTSLSAHTHDQELAIKPSSNVVNTPNEICESYYQLLHKKLAKSTPNLVKNSVNLFTFASRDTSDTRRDVFEYTKSLKVGEAARTAAANHASITDLTNIKTKFGKNFSSPTAKQPCQTHLEDFETLSMAEFVNGIYSRSNAAYLLARSPGDSMEQIIEDDEIPIQFKRSAHLRKSSTFSKQTRGSTAPLQEEALDSFRKLEPVDTILQPVESTLNSSGAQSRIRQIQMKLQSVLDSKKVEPENSLSKPARSKSRKSTLFSAIKTRNLSSEQTTSRPSRYRPKRTNSSDKGETRLINVKDLINKFENKLAN